MRVAVSDIGMKDHVKRLLSEANAKFSLHQSIVDKTHSYKDGEEFPEYYLGKLRVLWSYYEGKFNMQITSYNDEFGEAALYVAEGLKNNPSVGKLFLELHNPEKAQITAQSSGQTQPEPAKKSVETKTTAEKVVIESKIDPDLAPKKLIFAFNAN